MPPRRFSRHQFCAALQDDAGRLFLTDRVPYRYRTLPDTISHVAEGNETLHTIAGLYYREAFPRPEAFWWAIGDFQPDPVHDPTLLLDAGRVILVPSIRTITEEIFSERRRRENAG